MLEITRAVVVHRKDTCYSKTRLVGDADHKIVWVGNSYWTAETMPLAIHGRARAQMYTGGQRQTGLLLAVKSNPRTCIFRSSATETSPRQQLLTCFDRCGVDAIMGQPGRYPGAWIFREVKHYLETEPNFLPKH